MQSVTTCLTGAAKCLCGFAAGFGACAIACQIKSATKAAFRTCIFACEATLAGSSAVVCGVPFLECVFNPSHVFNGPKTCPGLP